MDCSVAQQRTIGQLLKERAERYGSREFMRYQDKVYSFTEIDQESDQVAAGLQKIGVVKGDKVAIILSNRPEYLFSWFGLSKLGAVEVPINTAHLGELLTYMLNQSDSRMIIVEETFVERLQPILKLLPKVEKVIVLGDEKGRLAGKETSTFAQLISNDGSFVTPQVSWADPFVIMYTSGTTGPSKGALMPHNYALLMGEICAQAAGYSEDDCLYNALPLFHGNAQLLSTMAALVSGAKMVLAPKFSASKFWADIARYGCTSFNYIGAILSILWSAEPHENDADNPLRIMFGAGAPMDMFEKIEQRFGVTLIEGYGMSEIGVPLLNSYLDRVPGTCGKCLPGYHLKIVDDDGYEVAAGTPGELLIRVDAPYSILLEYYNMPNSTVEAWRDLWFHTGDYLYCDEQGYYHFVDRKKDALRRRGENISSYEVEKVVNSHPAVSESAAVAAKSELGEDEVLVCLTLKENADSLQPEELISFCEERMAYFMVPRYLRFLKSMPKTPTQRIQKYQLRQEGITPDTWDRETGRS